MGGAAACSPLLSLQGMNCSAEDIDCYVRMIQCAQEGKCCTKHACQDTRHHAVCVCLSVVPLQACMLGLTLNCMPVTQHLCAACSDYTSEAHCGKRGP